MEGQLIMPRGMLKRELISCVSIVVSAPPILSLPLAHTAHSLTQCIIAVKNFPLSS